MNVVFIVPTGIGAEIGGHSGDATPAAKLVASVCDKLIIHPNVVNASDINDMTENMFYVEGSMLDRFLEGEIGLKEVYSNKILVVVNFPVLNETINAINAAKVTIGADIQLVSLETPLVMIANIKNGKAIGEILGMTELFNQIRRHDFDVLIVNTKIITEDQIVRNYLEQNGGTNPWGGVEAELSLQLSSRLGKPVIHAPIENSSVMETFNQIVDPRKAAELVSRCYIHCCFKGAHKAPKLSMAGEDYWNSDIDFMVSPAGLFGRPHTACKKAGIPIIGVKGNKTAMDKKDSIHWEERIDIFVDNYLEAVGVICAKKAGVTLNSVLNNIGEL